MCASRVIVALSGGVDSAVSAALLKEAGYEVIGASMHLWCEETSGQTTMRRSCCSEEDLRDAERICQTLAIPFYRMNLQQAFRELVVDHFCTQYSRGLTPNPCIACNQHLKFGLLLAKAASLGARLATGHYAKIEKGATSYRLLKARDYSKDQTYFLFTLGQLQLSHLLFPVGDLLKSEVRDLAARFHLPVAEKAESQDICFVPDRDYRSFLARRVTMEPGEIVDAHNNHVGNHAGTALFTIGQRKGLGLTRSSQARYVLSIDAPANRIVVGPEDLLFSSQALIQQTHWVSGSVPEVPVSVKVKVRHHSPEAEASIVIEGDNAVVAFRHPQRAIAPGQAAVFYDGEEVLGGGIIVHARGRDGQS